MARAYYAIRISPNLSETPEGYLLAKDCVLARTGFQTYKVGDLPREKAQQLGVDVSNPEAMIDLYRPEEEVFSPETLASLEGKTITDNHPRDGFVDPTNEREHHRGHIQNIRKGWEPLESGDWPMLGDMFIKDAALIGKVKNNIVREISLGYDFSIAREGDKIMQVGIRGNHCAVVAKGRAGAEARINDSAPETTQNPTASAVEESAVAGAEGSRAGVSSAGVNTPHKEKRVAKNNLLSRIFGLGLKQFAQDAEPEDVATAATQYRRTIARDSAVEEEEEHAEDRRADDRRADDRRADDRRAADSECTPGKGMHKDCKDGKCMAKDARARDAEEEEYASKMHAALDRRLQKRMKTAEDKDEEELSKLFAEEEEAAGGEEAHAGDRRGRDESEEEMEAEGADGHEAGSAEVIEPLSENEVDDIPDNRRANDEAVRAADAAEFEFLQTMRPMLARHGSPKERKAFNARLDRFQGRSRVGDGNNGYRAFAGAATARARDTGDAGVDHNAKLQDAYSSHHRKNPQEVK